MMPEAAGPRFINVDLEVWSRTDLAPLAAAVESKALTLYACRVGRRFLVALEAKSRRLTDPERTIRILLRLIDSLPRAARRAWKEASARVFDIGFDGGTPVRLEERPKGSGRWFPARGGDAAIRCQASLSPDLLRAVARVNATIVITVYAPAEYDGDRRARR